jgi:HK97 gp10 family phage protein
MTPLTFKIEGLDELKRDIQKGGSELKKEVKWAMSNSVNVVKNSAQVAAPYKTGTLRRSIYTDIQDSGFKGIVGQDSNMASYGIGVEYGTRPHTIEPVNKRALYWKGALYPVRRVNHPGTAAHPFMQPALDDNIDNIKAYFDKAILNIVHFMARK